MLLSINFCYIDQNDKFYQIINNNIPIDENISVKSGAYKIMKKRIYPA